MRSPHDTHLSDRDRSVIEFVAKFRQARADHIHDVLFYELASRTPLDRTLRRLIDHKYIARTQRRMVGGHGSGSEQYVYQIGRQGWRLLGRPGAYWVPRTANPHTLTIADCYVKLVQAERRGELELLCFVTEQEGCHRKVGDITLTPDAYVEVGSRTMHLKFARFVEVDLGTEKDQQIREKCIRYWRAYQRWEDELYPRIMFVVPDQDRAARIMRVIEGGPAQARRLFEVCVINDFACIGRLRGKGQQSS